MLSAQQVNDEGYTAQIKKFTTESYFSTELVDHLPASATVPTPEKILGHIVGAPDMLTYSADIYKYFRTLEKATPRVKVFVSGKTEEGKETLLIAVSDVGNIQKLQALKDLNAKLADPRKISEEEAKSLIKVGVPFYWASGSIHSPETGSPEMLMELAYRLAVEDSPMIRNIRQNSVILITPMSEVDGHDRQVDLYRYKKAHPTAAPPSLLYWGKYVAHDNNRDGVTLSLQLSKIATGTFLEWHPVVMHDLHESVPFLYISTGTGPYNPWLDPIAVDEFQQLAYREIEEMTKRNVPGVWTHGFYDGWSPNYMLYAATGHNSIGRFYETFGQNGADTGIRSVPAASTSRTWFRPNPPMSRVNWSFRNNINMQQSAILFAMEEVASNKERYLNNFYLKSKRAVAKGLTEGPAAYVIPGDDPRPVEAAGLVKVLQQQGIEVHKSSAEVTVGKDKFPAGSYIVRMDQPYSRMADMILDRQFYNATDPRPYDDTGWTAGPLRNVKTVRVTDAAVLKAPMTILNGAPSVKGRIQGTGTNIVVLHNTENSLATFRYALSDIPMKVAEAAFELNGTKIPAGSFLIAAGSNRDRIAKAIEDNGLTAMAAAAMPTVASHDVKAPRIALVHTWINTQTEGWYRMALDQLKIPYAYISDHTLRDTADLRSKYDVIIFGPVNGAAQRLVNGMPMNGEPIPWKGSDLTPNFASSPDTTDDIRGGMGLEGVVHLKKFIESGGLFVTVAGNASIPIDYGLIDGVSITPSRDLQVLGSVVGAVFADKGSPIAYGYKDELAVYFNQSPLLEVSGGGGGAGGGGGRGGAAPVSAARVSGRGGPNEPDIVQGRAATPLETLPRVGEDNSEQADAMRAFQAPANMRPRTILRFAAEPELLISGMLAGGKELAGKPAVVDVPSGKGHVVLFANNPMWRSSTQGSYFLLLNAILNFDHLDAGRAPARTGARPAAPPAN